MSTLSPASFSGFLYQKKIITREQARAARDHCKSGSGNFDYVTIKEQGLLPPDELRELHREYLRTRVVRCFGAEGQYVYASDPELASKVPHRTLAPVELFFRAQARRACSFSAIVTESGTVDWISLASSAVERSVCAAKAEYSAETTACSISAPEKPSQSWDRVLLLLHPMRARLPRSRRVSGYRELAQRFEYG